MVGQNRIYRVGQNGIYAPYMIVYLVISLPKLLNAYIHRDIILANPSFITLVLLLMVLPFPTVSAYFSWRLVGMMALSFRSPASIRCTPYPRCS